MLYVKNNEVIDTCYNHILFSIGPKLTVEVMYSICLFNFGKSVDKHFFYDIEQCYSSNAPLY